MPNAPDSLRKRIQQLQTRLSAIEAQQAAARRAALTFLRQTIAELGLTGVDVAEALRGSTSAAPRTGRRRGRPAKAAAPTKGRKRSARKGAKGRTQAAKSSAASGTGAAKRGARKAGSVAKVPAKYRGPEGDTWSGRGKQPRWMAALVATGRTPAEFLIAK